MASELNAVNRHCLNTLMELSEKREVVASEDIYDVGGMKLWAGGVPVSRSLQEKLLRRRLVRPLEASLAVTDGVTMPEVIRSIDQLVEQNDQARALASARILEGMREMAALRLPGPIALLLTGALETDAAVFRHGALTAFLAYAIAVRCGATASECRSAALAGLLHDLGEMYVDPDYLHSGRRLHPHEWKHVATHPRIGQILIEELTSFPRAVARAVGEHHERVDGSGYPKQVPGTHMSTLGAIVTAAETLSGVLGRPGGSLAQACLALRIVPNEHSRPVIDAVARARQEARVAPPPDPHSPDCVLRAQALGLRIEEIRAEARRLEQARGSAYSEAVGRRAGPLLVSLVKALRATGVAESALASEADIDHESQMELNLVNREITWRLRSMARNIHLAAEELDADSRALELRHLRTLTDLLDSE